MQNPDFPGFSEFAATIARQRYCMPGESWRGLAQRVAHSVMSVHPHAAKYADYVAYLIESRVFLPGGRYLYASGRKYHQTQNCLLLRAQDSRAGWAEHVSNVTNALMTGAGVGCDYSALRAEGSDLGASGGSASGPIALMLLTNEIARAARQGGSRRGALWAGLNWQHADIQKFISAKDWSDEIKAAKASDFNAYAPLDCTNISVQLDDEFFYAINDDTHPKHALADRVFWRTMRHACETGDPGFSVDVGTQSNETLRNACTEITSEDDSDICNLGSINLARITDLEMLARVCNFATLFLLCGTVYSDVPYPKVSDIRSKNRRLGLGIMGLHEWLLQRGLRYEPCDQLAAWLTCFSRASDRFSRLHADAMGLSHPKAVRAIAPTGTIGIVAETTTGAEPIFATAYKRRYRVGADEWRYQYVCDPVAKRLVAAGAAPESIEDALTLAKEPQRRIAMQAFLQRYIDHGISSTINLPEWGSEHNNASTMRDLGRTLLDYLPALRGITLYPDGARSGQPLTRVEWDEALAAGDAVFIESVDVCDLKGGSCGS